MNKEAIESRFFLKIDDSIVAPPGAEEAYFEARRWSEGIPTTNKAYAGLVCIQERRMEKEDFSCRRLFIQKQIDEIWDCC